MGVELVSYSCDAVPATVELSVFRGNSAVCEYHLVVRPAGAAPIETQLDWLTRAYFEALAVQGVPAGTAVFRRFFCSDLAHQADALHACVMADRASPEESCAVSWVQQPPESPARVALWAYHVHDPAAALDKRLNVQTLSVRRGGLTHHWTTGLACTGTDDPGAQTRRVFQDYVGWLGARGLSLARNLIRTWVFVRDIDNHYGAMVAARREFFGEQGLTPQTHYVASTGIEGWGADPRAQVLMDAYALEGVQRAQVAYLRAPDHLGPTDAYGVTFERGTQVSYRDRAHVLISGTASIDPQGAVLHVGDLAGQVERTLDNVAALLASAGATPRDLVVLVAYVRKPDDLAAVRAQIKARCGAVPLALVVAPVCRPEWLVEIEGLAIAGTVRPDLPAF